MTDYAKAHLSFDSHTVCTAYCASTSKTNTDTEKKNVT